MLVSIPLPQFSGELNDDFAAFEERLLAWLRVHSPAEGFSQLHRCDILQLALLPNSPAATYYATLVDRHGFADQLAALRDRFASEERIKSKQMSALNKLSLRSFRDGGMHTKSEMVDALLSDLSKLFSLAGVNDDAERKAHLGRAFKEFPVCLKLIQEAPTYDAAVLEALRWEQKVLQRALQTASQAPTAEDKAKARLSLFQKIDTWRGSQDSLVDAPVERLSASLSPSLPSEEVLRKRASATLADPRWRLSHLPRPTSPMSAPPSQYFDKTALPTPPTVLDGVAPGPQEFHRPTQLQSPREQMGETTPDLSASTSSIASDASPNTPKTLPPTHPYFRVKPVMVPEAYRTTVKLARTPGSASSDQDDSELDSEEEEGWPAPEPGSPTVASMEVIKTKARRVRRKSAAGTLASRPSVSMDRRGLKNLFRLASVRSVETGYDHTIRLWEAWSGICTRTIQHNDSQVNRLAISPDKRYIAAAGNQKVRLYDVQQPPATANATQSCMSFDGHTANITALQWHCDGKWIVTGSEDGTLKIWDTRTATVQRNFDHKSPVNDCVIHPNQGELVSCDQAGAIKVWDLAQNLCTHELLPEDDVPMRSVTVASDGSCLVGGNNKGNVYVWSITTTSSAQGIGETNLAPRTKFHAHDKYLLRTLLSPDARLLATCSADSDIKIWNMEPSKGATHRLDKTLSGHQRWVWDMTFSADSAYLVSASSDHTARLWDLSSGQTVRQYVGHTKAAVCVALNDINIG